MVTFMKELSQIALEGKGNNLIHLTSNAGEF